MLSIQLNKLGKKFNREWIFRDLSYPIAPGQKLLISGGNGSGKSTLLQAISGFVTPNEGSIECRLDSVTIPHEKIKDAISFASPYLQLTEELTPPELLQHISIYKPFRKELSVNDVLELSGLTAAKNKFVRQFSSGMKQRLKLAIAILAETPLLLLDEPVSNLDREAIQWYRQLLTQYSADRTIIVCSNAIEDDHFFCDTEIKLGDYKPLR